MIPAHCIGHVAVATQVPFTKVCVGVAQRWVGIQGVWQREFAGLNTVATDNRANARAEAKATCEHVSPCV